MAKYVSEIGTIFEIIDDGDEHVRMSIKPLDQGTLIYSYMSNQALADLLRDAGITLPEPTPIRFTRGDQVIWYGYSIYTNTFLSYAEDLDGNELAVCQFKGAFGNYTPFVCKPSGLTKAEVEDSDPSCH